MCTFVYTCITLFTPPSKRLLNGSASCGRQQYSSDDRPVHGQFAGADHWRKSKMTLR